MVDAATRAADIGYASICDVRCVLKAMKKKGQRHGDWAKGVDKMMRITWKARKGMEDLQPRGPDDHDDDEDDDAVVVVGASSSAAAAAAAAAAHQQLAELDAAVGEAEVAEGEAQVPQEAKVVGGCYINAEQNLDVHDAVRPSKAPRRR